MDESGSGEISISDEEYKHYVGRRREFATAARSEVVAEHYPGKNFDSLSKRNGKQSMNRLMQDFENS